MNSLKKNAIHEAGHALIGKLFEDELEVVSMTLTPIIHANKVDITNTEGLTHIRPRKKTIQNPTVENKDKLIISLWGGLAAQNIMLKGKEDIKDNLDKYLRNSDLYLDTIGIGGDWEILQKYINDQIILRSIQYDEYKDESLGFAFNYLSRERVWETVESLAQLLLNKANRTLSKGEIEQHYKDTGFTKYLFRVKTSILTRRYKVSFADRVFYMIRSI